MRAARGGSAIKVTCRVEHHATVRKFSVVAASEVPQRAVRPTVAGGCQLENVTVVIRPIAQRCAVEIARLHDKSAKRPTLRASGEVVEHAMRPTATGG